MSLSQQVERWSAGAEAYHQVVPKLTSQGGVALLKLVDIVLPLHDGSHVLDFGAGSGALTSLLRQKNSTMPIVAADPAPGMLEELKKRSFPGVTIMLVDANKDLIAQGLQPNSFTHVLNTFVLQFVSPVQHAVDEIFRVLQPGGIIGSAIWSQAEVNLPWTTACKNIDPTYEPNDAAFFAEPLKSCEDLERYYTKAGFVDARSEETLCYMQFPSAEEFADYFLHSGNPPFMAAISTWKGNPEVRSCLLEHRTCQSKLGGIAQRT